MRGRKASKSVKIAAGIMVVMMLFAVLLSAVYIAAEADHDCCGEDCHVCACIRLCESLLSASGFGKVSRLSAIVPILLILFAASVFFIAALQGTLISRKVRLNN